MNAFQHGVINGLGWCLVLADGWILHTHWLALWGLGLIVYSLWNIGKDLK